MKNFCLLIAIGAAAGSQALIVNGSFEEGVNPPTTNFWTLHSGNTDITGWTVLSGSIEWVGTYWDASDGSRSLDMSGAAAGAIGQVLNTQVGVTYEVLFDLAGNPVGGPAVKTLSVSVDNAAETTETYTFDVTGKNRTNMGWTEHSFIFTADSAETLLTFRSHTAGLYGPALDNVRAEAVPEPMTMAVLGGLGALALRRRKNA